MNYNYITDVPNVLYGTVEVGASNVSSDILELKIKIPHLFPNTVSVKRPSNSTFLNAIPISISTISIENTITLPLAHPIPKKFIQSHSDEGNVTIVPEQTISKGQKVMVMKTDLDELSEATIIRII